MNIVPRTFFPPEPGARPNPELLARMAARDRLVHAHEEAHQQAAGIYAVGGISYTYQEGPDGQLYAIGGHVNIDTSELDDPDACIEKMETVRRSALAPTTIGDTLSHEDLQVAALATRRIAEAKVKKATRLEEQERANPSRAARSQASSGEERKGAHRTDREDRARQADREGSPRAAERDAGEDPEVFFSDPTAQRSRN